MSAYSELNGGALVGAKKPKRMKVKKKGWVTIGGRPEGGKQHAGGTPVYIGSGGDIKKGPKELKGQNVNNIKPKDEVKPSGIKKKYPPKTTSKYQDSENRLGYAEAEKLFKQHGNLDAIKQKIADLETTGLTHFTEGMKQFLEAKGEKPSEPEKQKSEYETSENKRGYDEAQKIWENTKDNQKIEQMMVDLEKRGMEAFAEGMAEFLIDLESTTKTSEQKPQANTSEINKYYDDLKEIKPSKEEVQKLREIHKNDPDVQAALDKYSENANSVLTQNPPAPPSVPKIAPKMKESGIKKKYPNRGARSFYNDLKKIQPSREEVAQLVHKYKNDPNIVGALNKYSKENLLT